MVMANQKQMEPNHVRILIARGFTDIEEMILSKSAEYMTAFLNSEYFQTWFFVSAPTGTGDLSTQQAFNKIKLADWLLVLEKKRFWKLRRHHHTIYLEHEDCVNAVATAGVILRKTMYQLGFKSEAFKSNSVPYRIQNMFFKWFMKEGKI